MSAELQRWNMSDAAAFAATEAIRNGDFDRHLTTFRQAVYDRERLLDRSRSPRPLPRGQVWAWMNGPGSPHWEIRGTGAIWPDPAAPAPAAGGETP